MKRYWSVMALSTFLGGALLATAPKVFFIPVYVVALFAAMLAAFGLQGEALRSGRALRELEDAKPAPEPAQLAKPA